MLTGLRRAWLLPLVNRPVTAILRAGLRVAGRTIPDGRRLLPRGGTIRERLPNGDWITLISPGDDPIATSVYWRGWTGPDPETLPLFWQLCEHARTILDIGAHIGVFSIVAAKCNPDARVYAFEPLPRAYTRLTGNLAASGAENVIAYRLAAAAESGTATFYHVGGVLPSSSSLSRQFMSGEPGLQQTEVDLVAVDDWAGKQGIECVDLVKIDTETTEPQVLEGMKEILARDRPLLVCEVLPGDEVARKLESILRPLGYHFFRIGPGGLEKATEIRGGRPARNYLFAPTDDPLREKR